MPTYRYPRPSVTVDVVCFAVVETGLRLLLIERKHDPFAGSWALPGGFVDMDEELETAARRELEEETGLRVGGVLEVGMFGKVDRDPRGRTISCVYGALMIDEMPTAHAGDDASACRWWSTRRLPKLAFDHREVVAAARARMQRECEIDGVPLVALPERFTSKQLARLHEAFTGQAVNPGALRQKLLRRRAVKKSGQVGRETLLAVR